MKTEHWIIIAIVIVIIIAVAYYFYMKPAISDTAAAISATPPPTTPQVVTVSPQSGATVTPPPPTPAVLKVQSATYGAGGPTNTVDVTHKVQGYISNNQLDLGVIQTSPDVVRLFGVNDPAVGYQKQLVIDYTLGGTPYVGQFVGTAYISINT